MANRDPFYEALGHTIKVARTDLGIDRKALAIRAGISYSYLAAIENGQKQPSSQVLLDIADALGMRSHHLLESAEGRHERNLTATEAYPTWLAGPQTDTAIRPSAPMATAPEPDAFAPEPDTDETDAFIQELVGVAAEVPRNDRRLLLDLARNLADRPR